MDGVKLMDRTDTKYIFNKIHLDAILSELIDHYRILEINENKISRYESLYFDTPNFDLFHKHQNGKLNRYKIRFRRYVESNLHFFEIKFKNNKGRTIKNRVKQKQIDGLIQDKASTLLTEKTPFCATNLESKLWVNYSRITLVNKTSPERVTLDINLHFKNDDQLKSVENIVIAEVKQDKASTSKFITLMKQLHIREGGISKYCFGVVSLNHKIKHNNFKASINFLKKINHDSTTSA
jgi:hypothetical protein